MINLFEHYTATAKDLEESLLEAGYHHSTVVLDDEGYLPSHILSPIGFFTGVQAFAKKTKSRRPKFFNEVAIPEYWEIRGDAQQAEIFEGYKKKGHIHYSQLKGDYRAVQSVEWWNEQGRIRSVDLYNQYGLLFGKQTYSDGELTLTTYFNLAHQEVLLFNHLAQTIQVHYGGKQYVFDAYNDFVLFYFKASGINPATIFYNSLGRPFFIAAALQRENPKKSYSHVLFWQEESQEMPGNMRVLVDDPTAPTKRIVVQNREEYVRIKQQVPHDAKVQVNYLGYLYPITPRTTLTRSLLIVTHSDQISQLELLVSGLPDYHFHIAARTTMSDQLMAFEQEKNVSLYPGVDNETLDHLLQKSSIYLDINHGGEVDQMIRKSFEKSQLIFAFNETLHDKRYVSKDNRFDVAQVQNLIAAIVSATENKNAFLRVLGNQQWEAGQSTIEEYKEVLG